MQADYKDCRTLGLFLRNFPTVGFFPCFHRAFELFPRAVHSDTDLVFNILNSFQDNVFSFSSALGNELACFFAGPTCKQNRYQGTKAKPHEQG
jgi:hypothetical protein